MSEANGRSLSSLAQRSVDVLHGVGRRKAESLREMGIESILDLITHYPRRYIDRSKRMPLGDLEVGEEATVLARVRKVSVRRVRGGRTLVDVTVSDGASYLACTFFNQPWRAKQLLAGREVVLFGRLERFRGQRRMTNPVVDLVGDRTGRIVPVYPQSDRAGLTTWELGGWIEEALGRAGGFADPLPPQLRERLNLVDRTTALNDVHFPGSLRDAEVSRRRLAFEELLRLQLAMVARKNAAKRESTGIAHLVDPPEGSPLVERFVASLPFELTTSQSRAIREIATDMARPYPMHRLLQGDVGSGKTVVATAALVIAVQGGHQGAFMAPTEVLAEQHFIGVRDLLEHFEVPDASTLQGARPLRVALLTNRTPQSERARLHAALRSAQVDVLVGTHALLTEQVSFASLGLVVVDEQHRFGVEQRDALRSKGASAGAAEPDMLVMTATPIPRTAAMTIFGDLEMTVLDELPTGRIPVTTIWARGPLEEHSAWARVREQVEAGHQAYVVCPLVEESERVQARSATDEHERLGATELKGLAVGLLHGQMAAAEKEEVMRRFRAGETSVLVSTTVVEVGVDVPNATVMVIEDADRFGLAQLHQLRGRVGRGSAESWCYLLGASSSPEAVERLEALERSADGFELAEVDLDIRGEGTILGTRQRGRNDLKLASLRRDKELVLRAREVAKELVAEDPALSSYPLLRDEIRLSVDDSDAGFLFKS